MTKVSNVRLTDDFLNEYRGKQPKWGFGGLGYIVYLRTYARKKDDGNLERWDETVQRFTEGNFRIEAQRLEEIGKLTDEALDRLNTEMERFYHLAFNLVILPPGRGLWMSGTKYAEKVGDAENNCWSVSMRPQAYENGGELRPSFPAVFTFDQAMKGGGVGINVQRKHVDKMPKVSNHLDIEFICDPYHDDFDEVERLGVYSEEGFNDIRLKVEDSRQGWAAALGDVIDAHYNGVEYFAIDISNVRPRGSEIKGFGGIASGPAPLVDMLTKVNNILNNRVNDYVSPTEWGDVVQNIGCCVVAGNVRRTALILIGDKDDQDYIESKNYSLEKNKVASQWRWASNNSVDIGIDTEREELRNLAVNIFYNGEPGYTNTELSKHYGRIIDGYIENVDGEVEGFNPCGEITLPNASPCNLFEINLPRIHERIQAGIDTESLYEEAAYLATRYAYRITFRQYEWDATRDVVYRHRRLGVGITGITDWVLMRFGRKAIAGFDRDEAVFDHGVTKELDRLYRFVRASNESHAKELNANPSIKVTTVKPSGTVSLLMGVSPGQHFHWSRYIIRRIRMASNAPLVPVLLDCGYSMEPAVKGFDSDGKPVYDDHTIVVEFPVKSPTADHADFQSAGDVPLKEQAALQAILATYWSDNAVSATLSFKKPTPRPVYFHDGTKLLNKFGEPKLVVDKRDEDRIIDEITDILDRYKGVIKSTSLLPHATDTYPQMPLEEITEDQYIEMTAKLTAKPWEVMSGEVAAEDDDTTDNSMECVGGSCPIK
ncbi:ribonucleoside-triphosphate reductase, adenosylcobalamin-dependent [Alteribacter populi]|uniref:ribonucleoside-triphosphate reductase, adenosylcobalamin-dependent n=1 Tax=Alteribacter populi TaxID=2011011 RepID=UPI000BBACBFF|nr:ribonucleoside-triphosphate reductase, adenosylcobalamin-dependent [Alteribacter populi]